MARTKDLQSLARELAQLEPSERARVMADAARSDGSRPRELLLSMPMLRGGTEWIGSDLRREDLYGDDGR